MSDDKGNYDNAEYVNDDDDDHCNHHPNITTLT